MEKVKRQYQQFKDESGDKKYFTMLPNIVLECSEANVQALYSQMKRLSGKNEGICYASEKYFMDKLGIGRKALKKAIKFLLNKKWVEYAGIRLAETPGGTQKIKTYLVKDIWKENVEYFTKPKGVAERAPLVQGLFQSEQRGVQKDIQGVSKRAPKNIEEKKNKEGDFFNEKEIKEGDRRVRDLMASIK